MTPKCLAVSLLFSVRTFYFCVLSCVWLFSTLWTVAHQAPLFMGFPGKEYWSGLLFSPPGIFLTQSSSPRLLCLLHWQVDSLPLSHLGSPYYWVCFFPNGPSCASSGYGAFSCSIYLILSLWYILCSLFLEILLVTRWISWTSLLSCFSSLRFIFCGSLHCLLSRAVVFSIVIRRQSWSSEGSWGGKAFWHRDFI